MTGQVERDYCVWRSDDNGIEADMAHRLSKAEAEALAADYQRRPHKQTYWVRRHERCLERELS